jgi:hypothetical protein
VTVLGSAFDPASFSDGFNIGSPVEIGEARLKSPTLNERRTKKTRVGGGMWQSR